MNAPVLFWARSVRGALTLGRPAPRRVGGPVLSMMHNYS